jgi:hypothetical protein
MNIWAWVERVQEELIESGRGRLAELIDLVPEYMSDNKHEQLDAVMPEAIALAREAKLPWVEVYLRHWQLQSCILQRYLVRDYLPEAVELIELANRDETRDCPQSVCTTQDLANCYAHADGPGYVKERLAVASETLARITPEWPCYTCISGEYATALIDSGEAQGALDFIGRQKNELVLIGRADRRDDMCGTEIDALVVVGKLEEALALNERVKDALRGESFMEFRRLDRARILARLGRFEEAKKTLPPYGLISRTQSQFEPWVDAVEHLALGGEYENDWLLFAQLDELYTAMKKNGVIRRAIRIAHAQARLALHAGRAHLAKRSAEAIEALLPELRAPLNAPEDLRLLREKIAAMPARELLETLPENADELLARVSGDVEHDLDLLERGHAKHPDHEAIGVAYATVLQAINDVAGARKVLLAICDSRDDAIDAELQLLHLLRMKGERGELERRAESRLASTKNIETASRCHWSLALQAHERNRLDVAKKHLFAILELKPEAVNTALLLAQIERKEGLLENALVRLDGLVARSEPGPWDWERMLTGTLLGRWDAVRDSAKRCGFQLEGEGPIDREGGLCRVQFDDEGETRSYFAVRTGPVTGRVLEIAVPGLIQHFADRVAMDVRPLNDPPKEGDREHTYLYAAVRVLEPGKFRAFALDGFHPGDDALARMQNIAERFGARIEVRSHDEYVVLAENDEELRGVYALVAVPESADLKALRDALLVVTEEFPRPLIWPALSEAIGDVEEEDRHKEIGERYLLF